MPCRDLLSVEEFECYLGLGRNLVEPPPTEEFRNIVFLGWGAEFERRFLRDAEFSPSYLKNLIARVEGPRSKFKVQDESLRLQVLCEVQTTLGTGQKNIY